MSIFYDHRTDMLKLKCDCCKKVVYLYKGQTDRLLANDYCHDHGWKITKKGDRWLHLCPECKKAIEDYNRKKFIEKENA